MRAFLLLAMTLLATTTFAAIEGQPAPEFKAQLFNGENFSLADHHSQVVVIHFWATWCAACQHEMPVLEAYYKQHHADGLQVLAISMDNSKGEAKARELAKKFSFPAGLGKNASFKSYGRIWRLPLTFVIDRQGLLRKDGWALDHPLTPQDLAVEVTPLLKIK